MPCWGKLRAPTDVERVGLSGDLPPCRDRWRAILLAAQFHLERELCVVPAGCRDLADAPCASGQPRGCHTCAGQTPFGRATPAFLFGVSGAVGICWIEYERTSEASTCFAKTSSAVCTGLTSCASWLSFGVPGLSDLSTDPRKCLPQSRTHLTFGKGAPQNCVWHESIRMSGGAAQLLESPLELHRDRVRQERRTGRFVYSFPPLPDS